MLFDVISTTNKYTTVDQIKASSRESALKRAREKHGDSVIVSQVYIKSTKPKNS